MTMDAQTLEHIKHFSIFSDIAEDEIKLRQVVSAMVPRSAKKGGYLFREGDEGHELFLLMQGKVRVIKQTQQKEEYTIVDLKAEANVFFGEMALMDQEARSASVLVLEDAQFLVLNRESFTQLGDKFPDIGLPITRKINRILIDNLRHANNDVILLFDALVDEIETHHL